MAYCAARLALAAQPFLEAARKAARKAAEAAKAAEEAAAEHVSGLLPCAQVICCSAWCATAGHCLMRVSPATATATATA